MFYCCQMFTRKQNKLKYLNLVNCQLRKVDIGAGFNGQELNHHHQLQKKALMNVDMFV
jgi:hypothetical protein